MPRIVFFTLLLLCSTNSYALDSELGRQVFGLTENLLLDGDSQLPDGQVIYQPLLLEQFYADIGYAAAWQDPEQARRVVAILGASATASWLAYPDLECFARHSFNCHAPVGGTGYTVAPVRNQ